jgi:ribosomal subunit interface protein
MVSVLSYNIRGENIEVTPALKDHVERKIGKLERYFEQSVNAEHCTYPRYALRNEAPDQSSEW